MELALKAYLIQCGVSEKDLKDEYGHDLKKLVNEAVNRGLSLPAGSKELIPHRLDEGVRSQPNFVGRRFNCTVALTASIRSPPVAIATSSAA
jgi:hypothetical protein